MLQIVKHIVEHLMTERSDVRPIGRIEASAGPIRAASVFDRGLLEFRNGLHGATEAICALTFQHFAKGREQFLHVWTFVRIQIRRIHIVDHQCIVAFEDEESSVRQFRAIDPEIFQPEPFRNRLRGLRRGGAQSPSRTSHKTCFFFSLGRARSHSGVVIPDFPILGDRHVAGDKDGHRQK